MSPKNNTLSRQEVISGCLLGMAVADALGVPREGLSPQRARKLFGDHLNHRLFFGRGMVSDDTEHACMTAQAILTSKGNVDRFRSSLAWKLRWWLLGLPAGIGLGTLRSIIRLWFGVSATSSGVHSAGNGPAMRAPIIGVLCAGNSNNLEETMHASTRITHRDDRAEQGAMVIAAAAEYSALRGEQNPTWQEVLSCLRKHVTEEELLERLDLVERHLEKGSEPEQLCDVMGQANGVTGYINNTVPVAIYCWLRYPGDYRQCVSRAIQLGGDADTVGAIAGALAGTCVGREGIPAEWLQGMAEWPRTISWMDELAERLSKGHDQKADDSVAPEQLFWPGQFARNIFFAAVVLTHGFRRLLPPY